MALPLFPDDRDREAAVEDGRRQPRSLTGRGPLVRPAKRRLETHGPFGRDQRPAPERPRVELADHEDAARPQDSRRLGERRILFGQVVEGVEDDGGVHALVSEREATGVAPYRRRAAPGGVIEHRPRRVDDERLRGTGATDRRRDRPRGPPCPPREIQHPLDGAVGPRQPAPERFGVGRRCESVVETRDAVEKVYVAGTVHGGGWVGERQRFCGR